MTRLTQTQLSVSRAEAVRRQFGHGPEADAARAAFDSLLADRDRLREALEQIIEHGGYAQTMAIARKALDS